VRMSWPASLTSERFFPLSLNTAYRVSLPCIVGAMRFSDSLAVGVEGGCEGLLGCIASGSFPQRDAPELLVVRSKASRACWSCQLDTPGVAPFQPGMPRFRSGPVPAACGPDACEETGVPTPYSGDVLLLCPGFPQHGDVPPGHRGCGFSGARPGGSFEAYHPSPLASYAS